MADWISNQPRLHLHYHPGTSPQKFATNIRMVHENGLVFEESYCYPRGGGQPGDIGTIQTTSSKIAFSEVNARDLIFHPVSDATNFAKGDEVIVSIDTSYRNALAQTHTAQHVVSAMADELWGASTVGNQLGPSESRIDFKFDNKDEFSVQLIEDAVNDVLGTYRPVLVANWNLDEIMSDDRVRNRTFVSRILERLPEGVDTMRVVDISGIDICPCAGSHVDNTRLLPPISVTRIKQKGAGKLRLYYQLKHDNK